MIDEEVIYKISEQDEERGTVIDRIRMRHPEDPSMTISGYLVKDDNGKVRPIAYYQIKQVV